MKTDYNKWTKEDLIKRVKWLERQVVEAPKDDALQPLHTSAEQGLVEPATVVEGIEGNHQNGDANGDANGNANGNGVPTSYANRPVKKPKPLKSMDHSKYATRFIALKLAYIGRAYNGFEYQCTGTMSTIEEELWKALVKACLIFPNPEKPNEVDWNVCDYSKCGRTDRGVSAFGQVVALRVRSNKLAKRKTAAPTAADGGEAAATTDPSAQARKDEGTAEPAQEDDDDDDDTPIPVEQEIQYVRTLNRILPPDIKIYAWAPNPPPGFSARFSCRERQYRYYFTQPAFAPIPNFLEKQRKLPSNGSTASATKPKDGWLDIDAMRTAAKSFEGLHDFRNFCKIDPSKQLTAFHRRIFEADVVEVDGVDSALPYLSQPQFRDLNNPTNPDSSGDPTTPSPKVYYFHVRGSAFLWHQIRCMVAILFLVGQGFEAPSIVPELLDVERYPRRPNYVLADDAPLVLWECLFGRREYDEGKAAMAAAANDPSDELDWVYIGAGGENSLALHGSNGLSGELWALWHERKIDEILANRLLDWVSVKTGMGVDRGGRETVATAAMVRKKGGGGGEANSNRVYEGGNAAKLTGAWVPVLKKERMLTFQDMNDKYAVRKGFANAAEMRALGNGNWRDAMREAKARKEALEAGEVAEEAAGE